MRVVMVSVLVELKKTVQVNVVVMRKRMLLEYVMEPMIYKQL